MPPTLKGCLDAIASRQVLVPSRAALKRSVSRLHAIRADGIAGTSAPIAYERAVSES